MVKVATEKGKNNMTISNKEKHRILNSIDIILSEEKGRIKEDFESVFNSLVKDRRSKDIIFELESYLISSGLEKEDRHKKYMNLIDKDERFVELLNHGFSTMYIYCSKEIENPFVCNDDFRLAIKRSSEKFKARSKEDDKRYARLNKIANIKHFFSNFKEALIQLDLEDEKQIIKKSILKK